MITVRDLSKKQKATLEAFLAPRVFDALCGGKEDIEPHIFQIEEAIDEARQVLDKRADIEDLIRYHHAKQHIIFPDLEKGGFHKYAAENPRDVICWNAAAFVARTEWTNQESLNFPNKFVQKSDVENLFRVVQSGPKKGAKWVNKQSEEFSDNLLLEVINKVLAEYSDSLSPLQPKHAGTFSLAFKEQVKKRLETRGVKRGVVQIGRRLHKLVRDGKWTPPKALMGRRKR